MQGTNFLFGRPNLNKRSPTLLFEKWEFDQVRCSNSSANLLPQENSENSFYTPPVEKISVPTPKAPVKCRKQPKKGDLRPKKLQYTDEELDSANTIDSGIHIQFNKSIDTLFCKQNTSNCNRADNSQKQVQKLRAKLDKIKVQANDKENDKNVIRNASVLSNRNNIVQESPVVFNPNVEVLSQCNSDYNWKEILHWLQPRRDVGLWIECCRKTCKKFRYVEEYHDPVDVPKVWYCEMNADKSVASCHIPQHPIPPAVKNDLTENSYNAGSIVWTHMTGFPWWPAMVDDCPETFTYYKLPKNSLVPSHYCVTFFNEEKLEYAWITKRNLKPLAQCQYNDLIRKTKFYGVDYKESLQKAYKTAISALSLSILERLKKFSFAAQYDKFYGDSDTVMDTNSDDEIPCTPPLKRYFTLKEYCLEALRKNQRMR